MRERFRRPHAAATRSRRPSFPVGAWLSLATVLAACAPELRSVNLADLRTRRPASMLIFTDRNDELDAAPGFEATWFPLGYVVTSAIAGRRIRENTGLADPGPQLGEAMGHDFARAHGLDLVQVLDDPAVVAGYRRPPVAGADLILDVRTASWSIDPVPWQYALTDPKRYAVHLEISMKLSDSRDGAVLVERACVGDDPRIARARAARSIDEARGLEADMSTYPELLADGGVRLKAEFARAAARCDAELRAKALLLTASP